jgi:hypothetical protein
LAAEATQRVEEWTFLPGPPERVELFHFCFGLSVGGFPAYASWSALAELDLRRAAADGREVLNYAAEYRRIFEGDIP